MPDPKPPAPAPEPPPKSKLGTWSGHEHIRNFTHRKIELSAPDMEEI